MPVHPAPVVAPAGHCPVTGPLGVKAGSLRLSYQITESSPPAAGGEGVPGRGLPGRGPLGVKAGSLRLSYQITESSPPAAASDGMPGVGLTGASQVWPFVF